MGFRYDFFVGRLRCPNCGAVSEPDGGTNMQTYIRDPANLTYMGVGFPLEIDLASMEDKAYWPVRSVEPGEPVRLLETWECPSCGQTFNWAEIVINAGKITSVEAVELNRATLARAHFISDEAVYIAAALEGRPAAEFFATNPVDALQRRLPA